MGEEDDEDTETGIYNRVQGIGSQAYQGRLTPGVSNLSLCGAIAVALAPSLGLERDTVLAVTYVLVVFSILFQGLTVGLLARRLLGNGHAASAGVEIK